MKQQSFLRLLLIMENRSNSLGLT